MEAPPSETGEALILIGRSELGEGVLHCSAVLWNRPKLRKGAPDALRHGIQWQRVMEIGRVLL